MCHKRQRNLGLDEKLSLDEPEVGDCLAAMFRKAGEIIVGDVSLTSNGAVRGSRRLTEGQLAKYRTGVGMVFQSFNLFQHLNVLKNLMMEPSIMLLDEPTSALDPQLTAEVLNVIKGLALGGRTSLIVTHELSFARDVASHVMMLDHGR